MTGFRLRMMSPYQFLVGTFEYGHLFDNILVQEEAYLGFQRGGQVLKELGLFISPAAFPQIVIIVVDAMLQFGWDTAVLQEGVHVLHPFSELTLGNINIGDDVGDITDDDAVDGRSHEHDEYHIDKLHRGCGSDIPVADGGQGSDCPVEGFDIYRLIGLHPFDDVLPRSPDEYPSAGNQVRPLQVSRRSAGTDASPPD